MTDLRLMSEYIYIYIVIFMLTWLCRVWRLCGPQRAEKSTIRHQVEWPALVFLWVPVITYRGQHQTSVEWKCLVFTWDAIRICSPCFFLITFVWVYKIYQPDLCGAVCICFLEVLLKEGIAQVFKKSQKSVLCHHQRFDWMIKNFYWQLFWRQLHDSYLI